MNACREYEPLRSELPLHQDANSTARGAPLTSVLIPGEHTGLDSSAVGHSLVWVDAPGRLLAVEELLHQLLDLGDAGGAAHEDNLVNVGLLEVCVLQDFLDRLHGGAEKVLRKNLE